MNTSQPALSGLSGMALIYTPREMEMFFYHAALMFAAFMVLMPFGIFVGRYMRHYNYWSPVHLIFLGSSFAFAIVGFILSFLMNRSVKGVHFSMHVTHAWFGLFTIICMTFAVALGAISQIFLKSDRKKTPIFPDTLHNCLGRLTYLLGIVSVFTGFEHVGIPRTFSIVLGITISVFFSTIIFLEIYKNRYPEQSADHHNNIHNYNDTSGSNFKINEIGKENIENLKNKTIK